MPNVTAYEASAADWDRLRSCARQAAAESAVRLQPPITYRGSDGQLIEAIGSHWLLDAREHHIEEIYELAEETSHEHHYFVLLPGGHLKVVAVVVEEARLIDRLRGRVSITYDRSHRVREFSDTDLKAFDFEKRSHDSTAIKHTWGDLFSAERLLVDVKGAGLYRALEQLRLGRTRDVTSTPRDYFHAQNVTPPPAQLVPAMGTRTTSTAPAARAGRDLPNPYKSARRRAVALAGVWLFLAFVMWANNSDVSGTEGFADGSYAVVTWSLIFALVAGLIIDVFIGPGRSGAFLAGAAIGVVLLFYTVLSRPNIADNPFDISAFWLTALSGTLAYLISAILRR
ncbi:hypothetical protein MycrhDRAFT_5518 [Mycolicibacterium rhodesiae JS60]|nr:hypothetical protein MycrhDRAFT_5518 [Mycolicibacterium rhodesiae JS60]